MESEVSELNSPLALTFAPFSMRNFAISRRPSCDPMRRLVYPSFSEISVSTYDGVEGSEAQLTASMNVCAFLNQEPHNLEVTMLRGQVEAGVSILL